MTRNQNLTKEWLLSLETQLTRVNQVTRNIALFVIKTITVFQSVIKDNVTKNTKNIEIRDQELPNNRLYNTSVVNPAILSITELKIKLIILLEIMTVIDIVKTTPTIVIDIEIMIDTEVTVEIIHKTTIDLIVDKDTTINPKFHTHLDLDMTTIIKEELHPDSHIDPDHYRNNSNYRYNSRSRYRSRCQSQGNSFRRYNYQYRYPSKPRDYRSRSKTPSQNRQQNRINQVDVKPTKDNDSTKFEIHTCQTTEIANTITPYSWFYPLYIHASETNNNILPSKLEILFLLDTGASISVLNLRTFHVISKQLNINVPTNLQNKRAKTLTVANQTEVPIIHYISMTCFTEVNHQTRSFNIDLNLLIVKSTNDKDSTKFEVHTCQITEIANTITPHSWFYPLYIHAFERKDNILPSKLEILFLLDTGASISVLNLPTFHVIAKHLNLNVP